MMKISFPQPALPHPVTITHPKFSAFKTHKNTLNILANSYIHMDATNIIIYEDECPSVSQPVSSRSLFEAENVATDASGLNERHSNEIFVEKSHVASIADMYVVPLYLRRDYLSARL